jgi:hypothetical protein
MATRAQPRRLGRPPAVDSTVTRGRILTAARRSFATRGYDATTNRDIAQMYFEAIKWSLGLTEGDATPRPRPATAAPNP